MPIANCVINTQARSAGNDLINRWADAASIDANLLTINFIRSEKQMGVRYDVMVTLLLPTAWTKEQAAAIQSSLARVLCEHFSIEPQLVHVVTQWVESGDAVENGEQLSW